MSMEEWTSLRKQDQMALDTISSKSQAMILGISNSVSNTSHENLPHNKNKSKITSQDTISNTNDFNDTKGNILSYLTDQHSNHGDIYNVLSSTKSTKNKYTNIGYLTAHEKY